MKDKLRPIAYDLTPEIRLAKLLGSAQSRPPGAVPARGGRGSAASLSPPAERDLDRAGQTQHRPAGHQRGQHCRAVTELTDREGTPVRCSHGGI